MNRTHILKLAPLGIAALLLAGCATEPGTPSPTTDSSQTNSYSDGPTWHGNTCMARTKDGRQVRVNRSNCPPKPGG